MHDLVVQSLTGGPPGCGASQGENAGAEAFQAEHGGEGGDFFVHKSGQAVIKKDFQWGFAGKGGQVDRGGGGDQFKMAGDGRASDPFQGTSEDEFQGVPLNLRPGEVVTQIVENRLGDFRGDWPLLVAGPSGRFFKGDDQPRLVKTGRRGSRNGNQG